MYNILIIDDEQLMRSYLADNISAICPIYRITGIACDGIEAMELLKHQHFDLVITDIRMPGMDGLSLCKYIYESSPGTKVVIISGYNEFEYARTAIKYQVTDYLLKPLDDNNLFDVLMNVKEALDEAGNDLPVPALDSYAKRSDYELFSDFLVHIIDGNMNQIFSLFEVLESHNITFMKQYACMILFTIDELSLMLMRKNSYDLTTHHLKLYSICQTFCSDKEIISVYDSQSSVLLFLTDESKKGLRAQILRICHELQQLFIACKLPHINITCGSYFSDIMDAPLSVTSAYDMLALILKDSSSPIFYESYLEQEDFICKLNQISSKTYEDYLKRDNTHLLFSLQTFCDLFHSPFTLSFLLRSGSYFIRYICSRSNIKIHYINAAYTQLTKEADKLISFPQINKEALSSVLHHTISCLNSPYHEKKLAGTNQIVTLATTYILQHYNEPLSLSLIADEIGVNSSYLSDLIHKSLGQSYSQYLLKVRMEQAVIMMKQQPNTKVYEIAEKTGFVSTKHFISVFKKYYGLTPAVYMEQSTV